HTPGRESEPICVHAFAASRSDAECDTPCVCEAPARLSCMVLCMPNCAAGNSSLRSVRSASATARAERLMRGSYRTVQAFAAFAFAICANLPLQAQDYPNRPIMLVVPYAAGGGNDVMARIVAEKMSKTLGQ